MRNSLWLVAALLLPLFTAGSAQAQQDPWFGADKLKHLAASTAISAGATALGGAVFESDGVAAGIGVAVTLGVGGLKEWSDSRGDGTASWRDMTWNLVGAAVGSTVVYLVQRSRRPTVERASERALVRQRVVGAIELRDPRAPRLHPH